MGLSLIYALTRCDEWVCRTEALFLCFFAFLRPLAPLAGAGTNPVAGAGRAGTVGGWEVFFDSTSLSLGVYPC